MNKMNKEKDQLLKNLSGKINMQNDLLIQLLENNETLKPEDKEEKK